MCRRDRAVKVTLLGPTFPFRGGIAHHTTLLYRAFAAEHTARLVSFKRQYPRRLFPGPTDRDASAAALQVPETEYRLDPLGPWTWEATARAITANAPDLLVVPWWVTYWAPSIGTVARRARRLAPAMRLAFLCHNVVPHEHAPFARALTRWALAPGHAYVAHARPQAEALRALLPGAVVRVYPHPLYDMFAGAEGPSRAEARAALGLPAEAPVALFFGFVRPYKGLDDLLAALARARAQGLDLRLVVAGEFWDDVAQCRARAAELGVAEAAVITDRYIPNEEVPRYFAAADVVALPYREATQSGIAAMAYGFGRPVIATTAGGLGDAVVEGVTGLLVPPSDPAALAAALVRFFREGWGERLAEGVARHRAEISWEGLVGVFEDICATAHRPPP